MQWDDEREYRKFSDSMILCRVFDLPCDWISVSRDYLFCHSCHICLSSTHPYHVLCSLSFVLSTFFAQQGYLKRRKKDDGNVLLRWPCDIRLIFTQRWASFVQEILQRRNFIIMIKKSWYQINFVTRWNN